MERARNTNKVQEWIDELGMMVEYKDYCEIVQHINALNKYISKEPKFKETFSKGLGLGEVKVYKEKVFKGKYRKPKQISFLQDALIKDLESRIDKLVSDLESLKN